MSDPYGELAERFLAHYSTLRGMVRYVLAARQLDAHVAPPPGRAVDVGGGAGHQAIRLARAGYEVVLLDPSEKMLEEAQRALAGETPSLIHRIELVVGAGEDAPRILGERAFDIVLCHGVLMYLEDSVPLMTALAAIARPNAIVSVLAKNAEGLAFRLALQGRYGDALAGFDADRDIGGLGVVTRGDTLAGLIAAFQHAGLDLEAWYGVRVFTDHLSDEVSRSDLHEILDAEWEAGRRDPYRRVARLLHLIGRARSVQVHS